MTTKIITKDVWTIIDIDRRDVPDNLERILFGYSTYVDPSGRNEHLYSIAFVLEDLPKRTLSQYNEAQLLFLNDVKTLMEGHDAFYFRIID